MSIKNLSSTREYAILILTGSQISLSYTEGNVFLLSMVLTKRVLFKKKVWSPGAYGLFSHTYKYLIGGKVRKLNRYRSITIFDNTYYSFSWEFIFRFRLLLSSSFLIFGVVLNSVTFNGQHFRLQDITPSVLLKRV